MCSDIIEFQFLQVLMTLKSCLAIADILKATEKTVHTQLSDKSVTNQIILGLIVFFFIIFFALHAFANSTENVSKCFVSHFQT